MAITTGLTTKGNTPPIELPDNVDLARVFPDCATLAEGIILNGQMRGAWRPVPAEMVQCWAERNSIPPDEMTMEADLLCAIGCLIRTGSNYEVTDKFVDLAVHAPRFEEEGVA